MRKLEAAAGFGLEPFQLLFVPQQMRREKFQCDGLLQHAVMREPDHPHAALTQRALEVIAFKHSLTDLNGFSILMTCAIFVNAA
jgi:hypothetical protein